jgi:chemotaxis protein CheD
MDLLKRYQIRVVATDVGGTRGRKIMFRTDTGRVFVRQVGAKEEL